MTDEVRSDISGQFVMELEDFEKFQAHLDARPRARLSRMVLWGAIGLATLIHVWTFVSTATVNWTLAAIVIISALTMVFVVPWMQKRGMKQNVLWKKNISFQTLDEGFELQWGQNNATVTGWENVQQVEKAPEYVFLWLGKISAIVLPHRAFAEPEMIDQFVALSQERIAATRSQENGA